MQQLKIEHKNTVEKKKDRREDKGRVLALSRNVFRVQNTDNTFFYVEFESRDDHYYFAKFKPDVFEYWCSCKDNSTRHIKCKHLFAIEFGIKWGNIKDIAKIPNIDQNTTNDIQATATTKPAEVVVVVTKRTKSYLEDDYDF